MKPSSSQSAAFRIPPEQFFRIVDLDVLGHLYFEYLSKLSKSRDVVSWDMANGQRPGAEVYFAKYHDGHVEVVFIRRQPVKNVQLLVDDIVSSQRIAPEVSKVVFWGMEEPSQKHLTLLRSYAHDLSLEFVSPNDAFASLRGNKYLRLAATDYLRAERQDQFAVTTRRLFRTAAILLAVNSAAFAYWATRQKAPLTQRISAVEGAIGSLKDLEGYLEDIKVDMEATEEARQLIQSDYQKAKSLEELTGEQLDTIRSAVNRQSWGEWWRAVFYGTLIGIVGSLGASILYGRYLKNRVEADIGEFTSEPKIE